MGFVEITLYDKRLSKNPVIRRTLFADKNSSKWCINDREVPEKEVSESTGSPIFSPFATRLSEEMVSFMTCPICDVVNLMTCNVPHVCATQL